jgi:pimeloyl-ACP methyl ester carboxylesterase
MTMRQLGDRLGPATATAARLTGDAVRGGLRLAVARSGRLPEKNPLPAGRMIHLEGRGDVYVVDTGEPYPGAPTVLLLHAVATTASLCWFTTVDDLLADYRVVLMDQRWHGRGLHSDRFSLAECADDIAALLTALDLDQAVVVGYSMGGALAQVLARQHPERISGLVLCSTATTWKGNAAEALFYPVLSAITFVGRRHTSSRVKGHADSLPPVTDIDDDVMRWAWSEFRSTSVWSLPEVLGELGRFDARRDVASVKVPTAVVVTSRDKVIAPARQLEMAATIPGAKVFTAPGGHASVVLDSERWRPVFLEALAHVTGLDPPRGGRPPSPAT